MLKSKKMLTVTVSHNAQNNQHVVNASEQKSVKATFVASFPKADPMKEHRERNKKAQQIWDYENPTFKHVAGTLVNDLHYEVLEYTDAKSTPFIEEWFGGYIKTKKFADLPEEKKEEALRLYEATKEFWQKIDNWAWELKAGYHEPTTEEVLSPDFEPTNKPNRYPL